MMSYSALIIKCVRHSHEWAVTYTVRPSAFSAFPPFRIAGFTMIHGETFQATNVCWVNFLHCVLLYVGAEDCMSLDFN